MELLGRLENSVQQLPPELAHVCWLLAEAVSKKERMKKKWYLFFILSNDCFQMPAARYISIGGFLMLRFILPGIKNEIGVCFFY